MRGDTGAVPFPARSLSLRAHTAVATSAVTVALLAACSSGHGDLDAGVTETDAPSPMPSAGDAVDHGPPAPDRQLNAGTVADGSPASLSGEGPALVAFTRDSEAGVVATLDCTACIGPVVVTRPGHVTPWGRGTAPLTGSYLVDAAEDPDPRRTVVIDVQGAWSVELRSWADLPLAHGPQEGTGAVVLRVGDAATSFQVGFTPAGPEDQLIARAISTGVSTESGRPPSLIFGVAESSVQFYDLKLPGVIALSTSGSWTFVPGA